MGTEFSNENSQEVGRAEVANANPKLQQDIDLGITTFNPSYESGIDSSYVQDVKEKVRCALEAKGYLEKDIRKKMDNIRFELLDIAQIEEKKARMFEFFYTTQEEFIEERRNVYSEWCTPTFRYQGVESALAFLNDEIKQANDEVFTNCYLGELSKTEDVEEITDKLCNFLKGKISEFEYNAITGDVRDFFNNYPNNGNICELERALYDVKKSTVEPFPLQGDDIINYFIGQIYAAMAPVKGEGFFRAMESFSKCSPEAFCTDSYTGQHYGKDGTGYEDIINKMILWGEPNMPRTWTGAIKDPFLRKLVSATTKFLRKEFYKAEKEYLSLERYAAEEGLSYLVEFAARMRAICEQSR